MGWRCGMGHQCVMPLPWLGRVLCTAACGMGHRWRHATPLAGPCTVYCGPPCCGGTAWSGTLSCWLRLWRWRPQVIDAMLAHPQLKPLLAHPSVSHGSSNLYMRGVLEEATRHNLSKPIRELLDSEAHTTALLTVNDKKLSAPLRVRLKLDGDVQMMAAA